MHCIYFLKENSKALPEWKTPKVPHTSHIVVFHSPFARWRQCDVIWRHDVNMWCHMTSWRQYVTSHDVMTPHDVMAPPCDLLPHDVNLWRHMTSWRQIMTSHDVVTSHDVMRSHCLNHWSGAQHRSHIRRQTGRRDLFYYLVYWCRG